MTPTERTRGREEETSPLIEDMLERIACALEALPSRRDMFAAAALQGLAAGPGTLTWDSSKTAREAVLYADAVLNELDRKSHP